MIAVQFSTEALSMFATQKQYTFVLWLYAQFARGFEDHTISLTRASNTTNRTPYQTPVAA